MMMKEVIWSFSIEKTTSNSGLHGHVARVRLRVQPQIPCDQPIRQLVLKHRQLVITVAVKRHRLTKHVLNIHPHFAVQTVRQLV